jgi:hypothetical protein
MAEGYPVTECAATLRGLAYLPVYAGRNPRIPDRESGFLHQMISPWPA